MNRRDNIFWAIWRMVQRTVAVFIAKETPWYVKVALGAGLLYAVSPYDIIPEWVPVFGIMDDLALAAILITWAAGYSKT